MAKPKLDTLSVLHNKHHALDHEDEPHCACGMEGTADRFVGAAVDMERSKAEGRVCFTFSDDPVTVLASPYYIRKLQDAELLPADAATAARAGLKWLEPAHAELVAEHPVHVERDAHFAA